jgi:hypothetical protein
MMKAPIHLNETDRLKALLDYNILDTAPEQSFDELVKMASDICGTPIGLVSLVDEKRQWFKAKHGLPAAETSREISFCGHAVVSADSLFVVPDSFKDERFAENPLVLGPPNVRFYAGAKLVSDSGHAVGTLCVIDHQPRELSRDQRKFLEIISHQVVAQLEIRKALRQTTDNLHELQTLSKKVLEQQEIIQSLEKLSVIGHLASGVSHEINNPLAIISGTVHILRYMLQKNDPPEKIINELARIDATVGRLTKIGKALRAISGEHAAGFKDVKSIEESFYAMMEDAKKSA